MTDPVVQDNTRRVRYEVTNPLGQSLFVITFPVVVLELDSGTLYGIEVYIDDDLVDPDDYTVDVDALTVTLDVAAAENSIVVLQGATPPVRLLNYPLRGGLPSSRLNQEAANFFYMIQELLRDRDRALIFAPSAGEGISGLIPAPEAGKALIGNPTANGFINGPDAGDIAGAQGYAENALASQTAAAASETNAAASAAIAQTLADSILWNDVIYNTSTPYSVTQASNGVLIVIDTSAGNKVVNLPTIASLALPFNVGIQKSTNDANTVTINRAGSDTVDGATSLVIDAKGGVTLTADTDGSPDNWSVFRFGLVADATITNAKLANMAANTIKGSAAGGAPSDIALAANQFLARSSAGNMAAKAITDAALSILDDATVAAIRATLEIGPWEGGTQSTGSGTAFDFTSVPSWVTRIEVIFNAISLSGTDDILVQIGDSGGVETSGYGSSAEYSTITSTSSSGFVLKMNTAAENHSGVLTIYKIDGTSWVASEVFRPTGGSGTSGVAVGTKSLSAALDRVRVTRTGSNTFDNGSVTVRGW
jgi:hypothetical protein